MAIGVVTGGSGSGKSFFINNRIIEEAINNPKDSFIVVVPEQYTMQTQKELVRLHPRHGLINIDIVSFKRLAFRVFEELGADILDILDDTGKNLILRKVVEDNKDKLIVYKNKTRQQGFIEKIKSSISELNQYNYNEKAFEELEAAVENKDLLKGKLRDIAFIYKKFNESINERYITKEDILKVLIEKVSQSALIKSSKIYFDEFTGFTPIQYELIEELNKYAKELIFTVIIDGEAMAQAGQYGFSQVKEQELFKMSKDTINALCHIAEKNNETVKVIKSFDEKKPYRLMGHEELCFLWQNIFRYNQNIYESSCDSIEIYNCRSMKEEAVMAAALIGSQVMSGKARYRDYAIISGAQDSYRYVIEDAMRDYDIPYFFDSKRSILKNPFVLAIRYIINIMLEDYSYSSVMGYLRTYMTDIRKEDIDVFDNYIMATGIRGYKKYANTWKRKTKRCSEEELLVVNAIRERIFNSLENVKVAVSLEKCTAEALTRALYEHIYAQEMEQRLNMYCENFASNNNSALEREYKQVYKAVMELFDKIVLLLGQEQVKLTEYKTILEAGLEEIKVSIIPPTADQVVIGDIKRTRLNHVKHIILIGANDGVIPKKSSTGGILSQYDREYLKGKGVKLSPTEKENYYIQKFYLYLLLTKAEETITISYCSGEEKQPSYLIDTLKKMFPSIKEQVFKRHNAIVTKRTGLNYLASQIGQKKEKIFDNPVTLRLLEYFYDNEDFRHQYSMLLKGANYRNVSEPIGAAVAKALYGTELKGSVTRLEMFAQCQYKQFLQYGLGLAAREICEFSATEMGTVYHSIMEGFFEEITERQLPWANIDEALRTEIINHQVEKQCEILYEKGKINSARTVYMTKVVRRVANKVAQIVVRQIQKGHYEPKHYELSFGEGRKLEEITYELDEDTVMRLNGVIDRIDTYEDEDGYEYIKVLDYKSSNKEFKLSKVYDGVQLQLLIYIDQFVKLEKKKGKNAVPAAAVYFTFKDPIFDYEEKFENDDVYEKAIDSEFKLNGLFLDGDKSMAIIGEDENKKSGIVSTANSKSFFTNIDNMNSIIGYASDMAINIGRDIIKGDCAINPLEDNNVCDYCEFKQICLFGNTKGCNNRAATKEKPEVIMEKIVESNRAEDIIITRVKI